MNKSEYWALRDCSAGLVQVHTVVKAIKHPKCSVLLIYSDQSLSSPVRKLHQQRCLLSLERMEWDMVLWRLRMVRLGINQLSLFFLRRTRKVSVLQILDSGGRDNPHSGAMEKWWYICWWYDIKYNYIYQGVSFQHLTSVCQMCIPDCTRAGEPGPAWTPGHDTDILIPSKIPSGRAKRAEASHKMCFSSEYLRITKAPFNLLAFCLFSFPVRLA